MAKRHLKKCVMVCTKAGTKYVLVMALKSMSTAKNPEEER
jgi:hypothetical protein